MKSPWQGTMIGVWYDDHPHWVVDYGCYSVTLRCRGTLPTVARKKLYEIGEALRAIDPADADAEALRRRHFAILDHTLDAGEGPLPFTGTIASNLHEWIRDYTADELRFAHWVIMPNHWHLLTKPITFHSTEQFQMVWRRFKARAARKANQSMGKSGPLWQTSLYDQWVRNETEYQRWIDYFRRNPIKAGLVSQAEDYPYLQ
jgi:REP element-mobilizing transposase RayT